MIEDILKCSICGCLETDTPKFYKHSKYGDNLCNKHYIQLKRHGKIMEDANCISTKDKVCVVCGDNNKIKHCHLDNVDDKYKEKPLCNYHYGQLLRNGIITDKNISISKLERKCCICGKTHEDTKIIYYKEEHKMYCQRHYSQIKNLGGLKDRTVRDPNSYEVKEDKYGVYVEVILEGDIERLCLIDIDDFNKHFKGKRIANGTYAYFEGKQIQKIILNTNELIDHIDLNPMNNRRYNLRIANKSQNAINCDRRSNNKSGYTGVCENSNIDAWRAYCSSNGKRIELGNFKNKKEAVEVRIKAEFKYFKEFRHKHNENKYIEDYGLESWLELLNKIKKGSNFDE